MIQQQIPESANNQDYRTAGQNMPAKSGPFLARVISHNDPTYMGILEVQIIHEVNGKRTEGEIIKARYLSPFFGVTSSKFVGPSQTYDDTQKSYGFWMVPPDVGNLVVVIYIEGDSANAYWIGCGFDDRMNFMTPGYAATKFAVTKQTGKKRVPVAEYNKELISSYKDATTYEKPAHPLEKVLNDQGLLEDDTRGITTSSARREQPSLVFGISTPGPSDKNGKKGVYGKLDSQVPNAPISRLGGSSFVMDDGDDKFLRKKHASLAPPEYGAVELGGSGDVKIPHNELIRLRTRTGHQILLHNSEDLIYIGNARGTTWIELSSDGKIDIYAEDSVSVRTKKDFNFYADRDFNIEAGRNINIKSGAETQIETGADYNIIVGKNGKLTIANHYDVNSGGHMHHTCGESHHIKAGVNIIGTSGNHIHFNGPEANTAEVALALKTHTLADLTTQDGSITPKISIVRRMPTPEPYPHHENLEPAKFKSAIIDRDSEGRYTGNTSSLSGPASFWKKYSTDPDTFERQKKV